MLEVEGDDVLLVIAREVHVERTVSDALQRQELGRHADLACASIEGDSVAVGHRAVIRAVNDLDRRLPAFHIAQVQEATPEFDYGVDLGGEAEVPATALVAVVGGLAGRDRTR